MSDLLQNIDFRTGLAGADKLEILMFTLGMDDRTGRDEIFGINVFKVREVMRVPVISGAPEKAASAKGMASYHGVPVPVIDLARYIGIETDRKPETMIVTEYNGQTQGLLVRAVANILIVDRTVMSVPPPKLLAEMGGLVTAITETDDSHRVLMLDAERVLTETSRIDSDATDINNVPAGNVRAALVTGDSLTARNQSTLTWDATRVEVSHGEVQQDVAQVVVPGQIEARTSLVGSNKMEILLFSLGSSEKFGINVLKVKEVCPAGKVTRTPNMPAGVDGIVLFQGHVIPVLNLASFMGMLPHEKHRTMMVTEFNNHTLGFLVQGVDRVIRVDWDKVRATEGMLSENGARITAITELDDGSLISILDVEQILADAFGEVAVGNIAKVESERELCIFFADDSAVARRKIAQVLDKMAVSYIQTANGKKAWDRLRTMADTAQSAGTKLHDKIQVIMTDAEMPEMDGYVLTQRIKSDRRFDGIPVVMHTSLSSDANREMARRVGVDYYVPKFDSMVLSSTLRPLLT
jgi:two-component system chemotaxis response regulator CheV